MQNRKQIEKDINLVGSFKGLAQAYEEISVTRMQRARGKVLSARDFLDELLKVYQDVRASYHDQIEMIHSHKNGIFSILTKQKNGKSVAILITSNNKLYGDIGRKVFQTFLSEVAKQNLDILIIGKVGKEMYDNSDLKLKYQYCDFPEKGQEGTTLDQLTGMLNKYEMVKVYYGRFINVIRQDAFTTDISGRDGIEIQEVANDKKTHFFFEPSLQEVLTLFENQIFGALFRQTLHESELSHIASRINQMEFALENIDSLQKKLEKSKKIAIKRQESAKRLQRFAGMSIWK